MASEREWEAALRLALSSARAAGAAGDVPVGAVVLGADAGEGVAAALAQRGNEREVTGDPTAHAEILALRDACAAAGTWRLDGATVVVTLEPCPMCAGAMLAARVRRLVWGAPNLDAGAAGSLYNLCADPRLNHEIEVVTGVLAEECASLLTAFFSDRRDRAGGTL